MTASTDHVTAPADAEEIFGGKPKPGTPPDKRLDSNKPPGAKPGPDGEENDGSKKTKKPAVKATVADVTDEFVAINFDGTGSESGNESEKTSAPWEGVICVEGVTTGDGREFSLGSLTWGDLPVPLRWNKEDSHGGMPTTVAVNVGNITEIARDGNQITAKGNIDLSTEDGRTVYSKIKGQYLRGVSIDADSITDADMEMIFPEDPDGGEKSEADALLEMLFMMPEKIIFHAGRIRAATMCDIPAFVEAYIQLTDETVSDDTVTALAAAAEQRQSRIVRPHATATSDAPWNSQMHEKRLADAGLTAAAARTAFAVVDGSECLFLHHEISENGKVGAANLTACAAAIASLNSVKFDRSVDEKRVIYAHLAQHLRDAGQSLPPADFDRPAVTAGAQVDDRPPTEWFTDPRLSLPTPITVGDDGRVYGHAAMWGECHVGIADACVTPPYEEDHPYFMTGEVACHDGTRVAVGQITLGTGHASLQLGASQAAEHYDNTGTAVADVAVGNDEHGIWVAGAVRAGTDMRRVRELRAAGQVSGDWRRIGGALRMVGLLAVNVPGYPVPKVGARVASGAQLALVAAGRPTITGRLSDMDLEKIALRAMANKLADRIGRPRREV